MLRGETLEQRQLLATVGDLVWQDIDTDGIQDVGEPGVDGVSVELFTSGGATAGSTTTSGGGLFSFSGLAAGSYYLQVSPPQGFGLSPRDQGGDNAKDSDVDPLTLRSNTFSLTASQSDLSQDVGLSKLFVLDIPEVSLASDPALPIVGTLDVVFQVPAGMSDFLGGYNVGVQLVSADGNVQLVDADEPSNAIFPGRDPQVFGSGNVLLAFDALPSPGAENAILDGMGLIRIHYEIDAGVTSTFALEFDSQTTFLFDGQGNQITNVVLTGGQIRVGESAVVGRSVFYNNSAFDGNNAAADASDDGALAPDKAALLPGGTGAFANYTSYTKGLNGLMVDIAGLPGTPNAADFAFRMGNDNNPASWGLAPSPTSISVRPGAGVNGADRVTLIWPDGLIKKTWLQVTVLATANTGLGSPDVFYFGNAVGEVGNSTTNAVVSSADEALIRLNGRNALNPAPIDFRYDLNRDRVVASSDQALCRLNATNALNALRLIVTPSAAAEAGMAADRPLLDNSDTAQTGSTISLLARRRRR
jgi:hypothetical protein